MTIEFHQGQSLQKMSLDSDSDVCEAASVLLGNIHTFLETMDARYDQNCPAVLESTVSSFRKTISLFGRTGHARFRRGNPHPEVPRHEEAAKTFLETCSQDSTCTEATRTTNSDDGHASSSSSSRSLLPLHPHPLVGGSRFSAFSVFKPTRRSPSSSPSCSRSANLERRYFELGPIPSYEAPASEPSIPDPSFHGSFHSSSFLSGLSALNSQPSHQQKECWCLYQPESARPSTFRIIKPSTTRFSQLPFSNTINHSSSLPVIITHPFPSGEGSPSNSQPTHSEPTQPAFNQPTDTLPQLPGKRKYSAILNQEQPRSPIPKRPNPKPRKSKVRRIVRVPAISSKIADIPADEYSWRKYGQKSIKGSLHPRGYYKCSSGQGCTARKHVERAMDDPSMLIVTYEDEHTHPTLPESRLAK